MEETIVRLGEEAVLKAGLPPMRLEITKLLGRLHFRHREKIAGAFPGVEKTFAVQAGRELRVFVQPDQIGDEQAFVLARNIASRIENDLQYPGQIKVTVIRETRCVEVAK